MATRLVNVVIDAADPRRCADWWADVLDWAVQHDPGESEGDEESEVSPPPGAPGVDLLFLPVPDPTGTRLHLDLASTSSEAQATLVERLLDAGATRLDVGQGEVPWVVLADPAGMPFCVLEPRAEYAEAGPVAAIVVQALDPVNLARFWTAAAGWRLCDLTENTASLCPPDGTGPRLEFVPAGGPKQAKNRLHLDVAPGPQDDQGVEVARLHALGARPVDVGQPAAGDGAGWVVLADPEGNEFCVLTPR